MEHLPIYHFIPLYVIHLTRGFCIYTMSLYHCFMYFGGSFSYVIYRLDYCLKLSEILTIVDNIF
jgi:hypothetical protein